MAAEIDFQPYLQSLSERYAQWSKRYTSTDAETRSRQQQELEAWVSPFDFGLMVQTVPKERVPGSDSLGTKRQDSKEKVERFPVLEGIRKSVAEHRQVLLVGRPGSGKSTTLARMLLEEARVAAGTEADPPSPLKKWEQEDVEGSIGSSTDIEQQVKVSLFKGDLGGSTGLGDSTHPIPVLIELRFWQTSILDLIRDFFKRHGLLLDRSQIEDLLFRQRLLLLVDGLNELPSEAARLDVAKFRQDYPNVSMMFTTRDLSLGGNFGVEQKLEMQPLTETQMKAFVQAYIPKQAEAMLGQLKDRLREFGQTPLLLWMLCGLFRQTGQISANLGEVFREFTQGYEKHLKADVTIESDRRWWPELLQELAFWMMRGVPFGEVTPAVDVEFRVAISKVEARQIFAAFLQNKEAQAEGAAQKYLEDLLRHHLIQPNGEQVEFRHQLLQEYYAAEYLLGHWEQLSELELKRDYLNYLKWTEPVALMLALMTKEELAIQVTQQALDIDLMLGAKLSGEVNRENQKPTIKIICELGEPEWLIVDLLVETRSEEALLKLREKLQCQDVDIRRRIAWKSGILPPENAIDILKIALKDSDNSVRSTAITTARNLPAEKLKHEIINTLSDSNPEVCEQAILALEKLNTSEIVVPLLKVLNDVESKLGGQGSSFSETSSLSNHSSHYGNIIASSEYVLENLDIEILTSGLKEALKNIDPTIRGKAIDVAKERYGKGYNPILFEACFDSDIDIREEALDAWESSRKRYMTLESVSKKKDAFNCNQLHTYSECIGSKNPIRRGNALVHLSKVIDRQASIDWAIQSLDDPHHYVRGHAIRILEELSGKASLQFITKLLSDDHSHVRSSAAQTLLKLSENFAFSNLEIPDEVISKCIFTLEIKENDHICSTELQTLLNLCTLKPSLLLHNDLEKAFLDASRSSNNILRHVSGKTPQPKARERSLSRPPSWRLSFES